MSYIKFIGGLRILDAIHVVTGCLFVVYLVVHLYMITVGWSVFSHIQNANRGLRMNMSNIRFLNLVNITGDRHESHET